MTTPFLTAEWRNLLMLNFTVHPALLAPHVPRGTRLDSQDGCTYVSLVAFQFLGTRVLGVGIPLHRNFEELNLRFYVRRELPMEVRRGVVFLKEVVPRLAIALIARALYNEPYSALPMRSRVSGSPPAVEYQWRVGGTWHTVAARATGHGGVPDPDSHAAFITEHYWGYTRQRDGGTLEYRVTHPRWLAWDAHLSGMPALEPLYGSALGDSIKTPTSVFIAAGSPVSVYRGVRLEP